MISVPIRGLIRRLSPIGILSNRCGVSALSLKFQKNNIFGCIYQPWPWDGKTPSGGICSTLYMNVRSPQITGSGLFWATSGIMVLWQNLRPRKKNYGPESRHPGSLFTNCSPKAGHWWNSGLGIWERTFIPSPKPIAHPNRIVRYGKWFIWAFSVQLIRNQIRISSLYYEVFPRNRKTI